MRSDVTSCLNLFDLERQISQKLDARYSSYHEVARPEPCTPAISILLPAAKMVADLEEEHLQMDAMHNLLGDTHGRCPLTVLYQSVSIEDVVAAERTSAWRRGPSFANKSVCNLRVEATGAAIVPVSILVRCVALRYDTA